MLSHQTLNDGTTVWWLAYVDPPAGECVVVEAHSDRGVMVTMAIARGHSTDDQLARLLCASLARRAQAER